MELAQNDFFFTIYFYDGAMFSYSTLSIFDVPLSSNS